MKKRIILKSFFVLVIFYACYHSTRVEESPTVLAKTEANLEWCDPLGALIGENKIDLQSPPLDWSSLERKFANLTMGGHHKPRGTA